MPPLPLGPCLPRMEENTSLSRERLAFGLTVLTEARILVALKGSAQADSLASVIVWFSALSLESSPEER